jgi:hypothetical protein
VRTDLLNAIRDPILHHVGIVVSSEKQAMAQMLRLGLQEDYRGYVAVWDVLCVFAKGNGGSAVEFVVPGSPGPLRDFNNGLGGLHHLAFAVPSLAEATARLSGIGVTMLEPKPVQGAGPFVCNFIPPIFTRAYAVELIEMLL